ncbi:MAG: tyrosine--tRNA ligase [Acidobacteria bacterium]|nr:tyrosine--tRNA ligase [Acidobacteriota bacterium]
MNLFEELSWRGLVHDQTAEVAETLSKEKLTAYIGFDPTAASLHVGSLLPMMALARLQRFGHSPIAIAGGGTGMIGDPSGKTKERQLLSPEQIELNLIGIKEQLSRVLDFETTTNPARIINNADWLTKISLIDFMRDIGKHFTVNSMLAKESIKRRLESDEGISFTEFTYPLLQAYDFLVLYDKHKCTLQLGGSDQWGNILAGVDLVRRLRSAKAHGLTMPLVTTSAGVKFGKTEAGAVWLDAKLTSPYRFYQFWLNTDDRDAVRYLNYFTWLTREQLAELAEALQTQPEKREAQRRLASEVTRLVHGEVALQGALQASEVLFGKELTGLSANDLLDIFNEVPSTELANAQLAERPLPLSELLVTTGVAPSKNEAKKLLQGNGICVNNVRVSEVQRAITAEDFIDRQVLVLRKGAKNYHVVKLIG